MSSTESFTWRESRCPPAPYHHATGSCSADIARQFKSYSGKHLLERYPEIQETYFWGGGFWKVGCYVGTTGAVSEEVVERYIEETEHAPE